MIKGITKTTISKELNKMAYNGIPIILYNWEENLLEIWLKEDNSIFELSTTLKQRYREYLRHVDIIIRGKDSMKKMRLI